MLVWMVVVVRRGSTQRVDVWNLSTCCPRVIVEQPSTDCSRTKVTNAGLTLNNRAGFVLYAVDEVSPISFSLLVACLVRVTQICLWRD